ncbi:MAG: hypothetical protein ABUK01_06435 [Leptospirales bacterium]
MKKKFIILLLVLMASIRATKKEYVIKLVDLLNIDSLTSNLHLVIESEYTKVPKSSVLINFDLTSSEDKLKIELNEGQSQGIQLNNDIYNFRIRSGFYYRENKFYIEQYEIAKVLKQLFHSEKVESIRKEIGESAILFVKVIKDDKNEFHAFIHIGKGLVCMVNFTPSQKSGSWELFLKSFISVKDSKKYTILIPQTEKLRPIFKDNKIFKDDIFYQDSDFTYNSNFQIISGKTNEVQIYQIYGDEPQRRLTFEKNRKLIVASKEINYTRLLEYERQVREVTSTGNYTKSRLVEHTVLRLFLKNGIVQTWMLEYEKNDDNKKIYKAGSLVYNENMLENNDTVMFQIIKEYIKQRGEGFKKYYKLSNY